MKYYLETVCIEVTRKCNMCCAHCLRGEAQNIDVDTAYIDRFLENVSGIGNITFTGGEPSLNVHAIEYTLQKCQELDIAVGSFYVVTNGKTNVLPLAIACLKWYAYCEDQDELCGLALSKDMFHDDVGRENESVLRGLSFFREDKFVDFDRVKIINDGRAEELGGFDKIDVSSHNEKFTWDEYGDEYVIESMIYLSANGEIRTNCDSSYENDDYTIGFLERDPMHYIIQTHMVDQMGHLPF